MRKRKEKKKKKPLAKPWLWMKQMTGTNALIEKWPRSLNFSKRMIWRTGKLQTFRVLWMLELNRFSSSIPPKVSHMCSNTRWRVSRTAPFSKKGHVAFRSIGFFGTANNRRIKKIYQALHPQNIVPPIRGAVVSKLAYMSVYFYASLCKFRNSTLWASVKVTD